MPDQDLADFTVANEARKQRVIRAILEFSWDNYRLHEVDELAREVLSDLEEHGESDVMDWARDLAEAVMVAARPISLAEVSDQGGSV